MWRCFFIVVIILLIKILEMILQQVSPARVYLMMIIWGKVFKNGPSEIYGR